MFDISEIRHEKVGVMHHDPCKDGRSAAAVVKMWFTEFYPDTELVFIPVGYGDIAPVPSDLDMLFVLDFGLPEAVLETISMAVPITYVIDHHSSTIEEVPKMNLAKNIKFYLDIEESGCTLTHRVLYGNGATLPTILLHIRDEDIWTWDYRGSREVCIALDQCPLDIDGYIEYMATDNDCSQLYDIGKPLVDHDKARILEVCLRSHTIIKIDDYEVPIINVSYLKNWIGEALSVHYPFVIMYRIAGSKVLCSLRSSKHGYKGQMIDVSKVARLHGGGGHVNSGAFRMSIVNLAGYITKLFVRTDKSPMLEDHTDE